MRVILSSRRDLVHVGHKKRQNQKNTEMSVPDVPNFIPKMSVLEWAASASVALSLRSTMIPGLCTFVVLTRDFHYSNVAMPFHGFRTISFFVVPHSAFPLFYSLFIVTRSPHATMQH